MSLVLTIRLHRLCNQACTFCTLRDTRPSAIPTEQVEQQLRQGREDGSIVVRFTGGEPLLDRRLPALIQTAVRLGFEGVEVETNATVASWEPGARALVEAGLTRAWVTLLSAAEEESDRLSRDPGGFRRTWEGLSNLARLGARIGICLPVTADTVDGLGALVDRAAEAGADAVRLFVPVEGAAYARFEAPLARAAARCRKHRMDHRFEPAWCPPPCAFSDRFVAVHTALFASLGPSPGSTDGGRVRAPACAKCALVSRCPGFPARYAGGGLPTEPPGEQATAAIRGQLGGVDRGQRTQLTVVQAPESPLDGDEPNLRVNWACNQRCRFCWVDFDWTPPTREQVLSQVAALRAQGALSLNLTGGEPTLVPWLPDVVREARMLGMVRVELQTNAVHLAAGDLLPRLVDAGLTRALVSLHSQAPRVNDAITQADGYWARTVSALDRMVRETELELLVNHVITGLNLETTPGFPAFVHERWGERVRIVWSAAAAITEAATRYDDGVAPFDAVGPALRAALEQCVALGVPFGGQDGTCGVPPCVLGGDPRFVQHGFSPDHPDGAAFRWVEECDGCSHRGLCRGIQRGYVARFGGRGIRRLTHPPSVAAPTGGHDSATIEIRAVAPPGGSS
ncbi:MAG: hypothetical protein AMXMBFR64_18070 [Myxococcales bacterium]